MPSRFHVPAFEADDPLYEARDASTRHLPGRCERAIGYVGLPRVAA